jgi:hypothetical protein
MFLKSATFIFTNITTSKPTNSNVRFEVLTAVTMKNAVFWGCDAM